VRLMHSADRSSRYMGEEGRLGPTSSAGLSAGSRGASRLQLSVRRRTKEGISPASGRNAGSGSGSYALRMGKASILRLVSTSGLRRQCPEAYGVKVDDPAHTVPFGHPKGHAYPNNKKVHFCFCNFSTSFFE
jgi:hypothetical protein